eukprot:COSAG06_NODE_2888_length_6131_cov_117.688660_7_plen_169_part_00
MWVPCAVFDALISVRMDRGIRYQLTRARACIRARRTARGAAPPPPRRLRSCAWWPCVCAAGSAGEQESAPRGRHARVHVGRSSSRPRLCQGRTNCRPGPDRGKARQQGQFLRLNDLRVLTSTPPRWLLSSDAAPLHAALGALLRRAKRRDTSGFLRASAAPPFDFASW